MKTLCAPGEIACALDRLTDGAAAYLLALDTFGLVALALVGAVSGASGIALLMTRGDA